MTLVRPHDAWGAPALHHDLRHQLATVRLLLAAASGSASGQPGEVDRLLATATAELDQAVALADALDAAPAAPAQRCRLDAVALAAARAAPSQHPRIAVDAAQALWVPVDATTASRVVHNLLDNALAAAGSRGEVLLRVRGHPRPPPEADGAEPEGVRLEVHDDGPGPGPGGFARPGGAGLDVVRALVLPAGGWLTLGRSPLGGACAAVTLPCAPALPRPG